MFLKTFIVILALNVSLPAWSSEKITVAFGNALAPWVMPETHNGIILDIITEALEPAGYEIEPIYFPYLRRISSFKNGIVDVVCDINANAIKDHELEGFLSDYAYSYENFAFALKEQGYQFKHLSELSNISLLSWQGAISHLGEEYAEMAMGNPFYSETDRQEAQIKMLFQKRINVVQLDKQIFNYFRSKVRDKGGIDTTLEVDSFPLFGKSPNAFLFRDKKIRNEFNRQLKRLKDSGRYEEILNRY